MDITWNDEQPIYRQLMTEMLGWILAGEFTDDEALPSIRTVANQYELNPLTVSKAYQELINTNLIYKRRGVGLFVRKGAHSRLLKVERKKFLEEEWPEIIRRIQQLELDPTELLSILKKKLS